MTRTWFTCEECNRECDNSVRAPENAPGEPNRGFDLCYPCYASYCPVCDSLYPEPTQAPSHGYFAVCAECGHDGYFTEQVARNIVELNHADRKDANQ